MFSRNDISRSSNIQNSTYYGTRVEEKGNNTGIEAQYTMYKLKVEGEHHGKLLLAIRGTWTLQTLLQDLSLLDFGQVGFHRLVNAYVNSYQAWSLLI